MPDSGSLSVKTVSRLAGLSAHTLRAWERRYGAVTPRRTETGHRLYSQSDVERLKLLVKLVEQGNSIGRIARLQDEELAQLCRSMAPERGSQSPLLQELERQEQKTDATAGETHERIGRILEELLDAIPGFELDRVADALTRARQTLSPRDFALEIIAPVLGEVGLRVSHGRMGISQEHLLSSRIRSALEAALEQLDRGLRSQPWAVALATAQGDLHEFGSLIGAVLCASHGLRPLFLGPNLPAPDFAEAVRSTRARVALLGTTPLPPGAMPLSYEEYLTRLDSQLPRDCALWLGGRGDIKLGALKLQHEVRAIATLELLDHALKGIS